MPDDPSTSAQPPMIEWRVVNRDGRVVSGPYERLVYSDSSDWDAVFRHGAPHRVESREVGGWR